MMAGLHRYHGRNGKYLVLRRDGTVPEWPNFVLGAKDPAAPVALRAYAEEARRLNMDYQYVSDLLRLADEFDAFRIEGPGKRGDPDAPLHRKDDPRIIEAMQTGQLTLPPITDAAEAAFGPPVNDKLRTRSRLFLSLPDVRQHRVAQAILQDLLPYTSAPNATERGIILFRYASENGLVPHLIEAIDREVAGFTSNA
jgi:hypothetical protein